MALHGLGKVTIGVSNVAIYDKPQPTANGDADYVLKVVLRDLKDLSDLVNNVLMPHQSVAHVRSSIVLDRLKESARLPL